MRFKNIFSFLTIIVSTLKRFLSREDVMADFQVIENRLQICRACEYKIGDALKNMKCQLCECKIRYKVRLASSACPERKWTSVDS
ncbi:MAG: hypothetical protein H8E72_03580 [Candidatus Marinimicrobia bacterium]|nr:hypothetical protein [Candidatus Neomarinimicrobiota bacterium]